jgi:hypothetical protein
MDKNKELLFKKYAELSGYPPSVEEWEPRIRKMLSVICQGRYTKDQIVDSKDTSIFSNGASGMVLTTEALCVKDAGNSTTQFIARFKDIKYCSMDEDSIFGVDISAIKLHMKSGSVYRLSTCLEGLNLGQMQNLLEYACTLHHASTTALEGHETELDELEETSVNETTDHTSSVKSFFEDIIGQFIGKDETPIGTQAHGTKQ